MVNRIGVALACLALVACGGSGDGITPPPPPSHTYHVELVSNDALFFTGRGVPLAALVSRVVDETGHTATGVALSATVPDGWSLRNDSIIPPSTEDVGHIHVTAADPSSTRISARVLGDVAPPADSLTATAGVDLRAYTWHATWTCRAGQANIRTVDGAPIDSMTADAVTLDSLVYPGDGSFVPNYGGVAQAWWSGRVILWLHDGTADSITTGHHVEVARQAPDSLLLSAGYNNPASGTDEWPALKVSDAPLTYRGGNWCGSEWAGEKGAVTLEGTPVGP